MTFEHKLQACATEPHDCMLQNQLAALSSCRPVNNVAFSKPTAMRVLSHWMPTADWQQQAQQLQLPTERH
jgi:hypothetical protein